MVSSGAAMATTVSTNTGSLGAAANGVNADAVTFTTGVVTAGTDPNRGTGLYNPNTTIPLTIGTLEDQSSPYAGAVDEVAFYGSALTATQVANHFAAVSSATPGAYASLVRSDGALLQLSNNVP